MARGIDQRQLLLSIAAPEHEHHGFCFRIDLLDDGVGKRFPAFALVRVRLMGADCQHCIEHQYPLLRPRNQKSVIWDLASDILVQLFVDIPQRRGSLDSGPDTEAQAMGLSGSMIRVLAQQKNTHLVIGRQLKCREDILFRRIDRPLAPLLRDKVLQLWPVRFFEFAAQRRQPIFRQRGWGSCSLVSVILK